MSQGGELHRGSLLMLCAVFWWCVLGILRGMLRGIGGGVFGGYGEAMFGDV